jgi:hypothetical protein
MGAVLATVGVANTYSGTFRNPLAHYWSNWLLLFQPVVYQVMTSTIVLLAETLEIP